MMNAQDSQGAFWSPQLTLGSRLYRRGYLHLKPEALKSSAYLWRMWYGLRWRFLALAEHMLLVAAIVAVSIPRPASGSLVLAARSSMKRSFDVLGALLGLIITSPLFLLVPVLIKLDSPGPVFYAQERVGLDRRRGSRRVLGAEIPSDRRAQDRRGRNHSGQVFRLLKFRSMVHHAERSCGPVWAAANDPRVTPLGRFLRRTRIDELPQFINVLSGDMSLVGPRPERPHFVFKFCGRIEQYSFRHRMKPGITGLAQVEQGYDCNEENVTKKVEYDLRYIHRWSPILDVWILIRTVGVVASGWGSR